MHHLIDMCKRLEGLPRHTSMHAAGVVICQKSADEFVPLSRGSDGSITTQFTMTTLEELGLLKMDFLGLKNLTIIDKVLNKVGIKFNDIPLNDKKTYELFWGGYLDGIFQFETII